jgi:predicted dehydrogenase
LRIGLVGYGTGGQHFHAPFIAAAEGVELAGVVARAPGAIAKVEADLPGTPIFSSLAAMIDAGGIDAPMRRYPIRKVTKPVPVEGAWRVAHSP